MLTGPDVRPDVIVDYFRNVPVGPNDALLFYYSGHGATFEGQGHVLTTSHGNLLRDTLRTALTERRPRLSVLLTDCCASLVKPRPQPPAGARAPQPRVSPMMRCLLLQHRGIVDLTSSSFGEISWGRQGTGGIFTHALTQAMGAWDIPQFDTDKDGFLTWTELFDQVRRDTQTAFREFKRQSAQSGPGGGGPGPARQFAEATRPGASGIRPGRSHGQGLEGGIPRAEYRHLLPPRPGWQRGRAQLTRDPDPGSGAAQLRLEPGDTIYNLDALPIRHAVDVMNHHGRTDVSFINVRTNRPQAGVMILPPFTPLPADVPPENYAPNLGIHYQLIPRSDGTFGARLSRTAFGNTPAAAIQLELGDMIIRIDGQPIRKPEDVLNHIDQTTIEFVNIRTGGVETRVVQLPGQVAR